MTRLADILGFEKKKEVSEKVTANERDFSHFTCKPLTHFCKFALLINKNFPLPQGARVIIFMVPSLFKGRLGWVFDRRKAAFTLAEVFSKHRFAQRLAAFTLAEVLITLGIIGVVAAITMPTLIQNHRNHVVETRLKKFYSSFNQAFLMGEAEFGDNSTWDIPSNMANSQEWFHDHIGKHMNIVKYKKPASWQLVAYFADGGALLMINNSVDFFYFPVAKSNSNYGTCSGNFGSSCFPFNFYHKWAIGNRKGIEPYRYGYVEGRDLYNMMGDQGYGCAKNGWWCTLVIQRNGWKIPDDYPKKIKY